MGEVAEHAGVHKPAVYRRWPNKLELIAAVLQRMAFPLNDPASGDIRSDLVEMLVGAISGHPTPLPLQLRIRSEVVATPELAEAMDRLVFRPRRAMAARSCGVPLPAASYGPIREWISCSTCSSVLTRNARSQEGGTVAATSSGSSICSLTGYGRRRARPRTHC